LHLDDLFARAARFGLDEGHLRHMVELAGRVFDGLKRVHQLDDGWKIYLLSTVILRNSGEIVGFAGRERHSYYIVKHSDFPGMQGWEHEFVARLCLRHSGGKFAKDLVALGKDKGRRAAFRKLLALVRVIDALDLGPRTTVRVRRISVSTGKVRLQVGGAGTAGVEQLMMERKKKLFEAVFGRQLVLERLK
jgi:exopolyphosphatase/guanosine-5'-triphosphate,3'-diphosphate pyrophosphatase